MSRTTFIILMSSIAVLAFAGMWIAWRGRTRRDAAIASATPQPELTGAPLAHFPRASYVSTTPAGAPLERVAIPGLRYKGYAEVTVHGDGVTIAVTGEAPVTIPASQIIGSGAAGGRIGKAVEPGGLSLLRWALPAPGSDARELESSFRLADPAEQARFAEAVAAVSQHRTSGSAAGTQTNTTHPTIQEEA
ncbi:PH-like domain-containing protein [Leucobacter chromiireducens]|uniref:PH-like domain-containing protein n=1 Tax=Leucobacter chromiireducens TaxID=283877 RepID=UPI003F7E79FB